MAMEYKSLNPMEMGLQVKVLDESLGIVDAIVSVTNVKDHVNDMVMPGAYKDTLELRKPKVCWGHDWKTPVGKTISIEELMPGDPRLPLELLQMNAGALQAKVQFNLNTTRGREAFEDVKFWQEEGEWSIGYDAKGQGGKAIRNASTGVREIHKMALFEMSPVLFGAAPHTSTLSVKSMVVTGNPEMKVALHRVELKTELDDALEDGMDPEDILELTDDEAWEILDDMVEEGLLQKSLVDYFELKDYDPQVIMLEVFGAETKARDADHDGVVNEGRRGNGRRGTRVTVTPMGSLRRAMVGKPKPMSKADRDAVERLRLNGSGPVAPRTPAQRVADDAADASEAADHAKLQDWRAAHGAFGAAPMQTPAQIRAGKLADAEDDRIAKERTAERARNGAFGPAIRDRQLAEDRKKKSTTHRRKK